MIDMSPFSTVAVSRASLRASVDTLARGARDRPENTSRGPLGRSVLEERCGDRRPWRYQAVQRLKGEMTHRPSGGWGEDHR